MQGACLRDLDEPRWAQSYPRAQNTLESQQESKLQCAEAWGQTEPGTNPGEEDPSEVTYPLHFTLPKDGTKLGKLPQRAAGTGTGLVRKSSHQVTEDLLSESQVRWL